MGRSANAGDAGAMGEHFHFGITIRRIREERGMSREELGRRIGLPASTLHEYETRELMYGNATKLGPILQALGVTFSEFVRRMVAGGGRNESERAARLEILRALEEMSAEELASLRDDARIITRPDRRGTRKGSA